MCEWHAKHAVPVIERVSLCRFVSGPVGSGVTSTTTSGGGAGISVHKILLAMKSPRRVGDVQVDEDEVWDKKAPCVKIPARCVGSRSAFRRSDPVTPEIP